MYPIILAHGIARFDLLREKLAVEIGLPPNAVDDEFQYFRNVRKFLNANGYPEVFNTNVDFAGSLVLRSEQLKVEVERTLRDTGAPKVHIIGHSMGGLDARRMIAELGMADRVASLSTIGTPHLGTVLADQVLSGGGRTMIAILQNAISLDLNGFSDLTTGRCADFNERHEDAEARNPVVYRTYSSSQHAGDVFLPLLASWFAIDRTDGANDGLVSVRSQRWKPALVAADGTTKTIAQLPFPIPADHLNQVGWWDWEEAVSPLFGGSYANQRRAFEMTVKSFYLDLVRDVEHIV